MATAIEVAIQRHMSHITLIRFSGSIQGVRLGQCATAIDIVQNGAAIQVDRYGTIHWASLTATIEATFDGTLGKCH